MADAPPVEAPKAPPKAINPAFRYLGIPPSVLAWRPKAPSPKVSVFLVITSSLISYYVYDRRECKRLKGEYIKKVEWMREELVPEDHRMGWLPRRVTVLGARVPEDVDVDRGTLWFKKYVKPILIAAAIDYKIVNGITPGGLGRKVAEDIHSERIIAAAQAKEGYVQPQLPPGSPGYRQWKEQTDRLDGGTLIMGRPALKEYLWGLKVGYLTPIPLEENALDAEERLSRELANESIWDRTEEPSSGSSFENGSSAGAVDEDIPEGLRGVQEELRRSGSEDLKDWTDLPSSEASTPPPAPKSKSYFSSMFGSKAPPRPSPSTPAPVPEPSSNLTAEPFTLPPQSPIPPQPPILLLPFYHPIGMIHWPFKLVRFFNHRSHVRAGGEAALALIEGMTKDIEPPREWEGVNEYVGRGTGKEGKRGATGSKELDFGLEDERGIRRSYASLPSALQDSRKEYLSLLPAQLTLARTLDRGDRERTKEEVKYPPKTEVELRDERVKKEKKWRDDEEGWEVQRRGSGICWEEGMGGLRVFVPGVGVGMGKVKGRERESLRRSK